MGWSDERIANALHVSKPTLRKHYSSELKARMMQRDRLDAWHLEKVVDQVDKGNVGAMRLLQAFKDRNDAMLAQARIDRPAAEKDRAPGKKQQAQLDAAAAIESGPWSELTKPH